MAPWLDIGWDTRPEGMRNPPVWPLDEGLKQPPLRRSAPLEPWERETEPFEGATVLDDLDRTMEDARATAVVIARYAVVRQVLRAVAGVATLNEERAAAAEYLAGADAVGAAERAALEAVLRRTTRRPGRGLAMALVEAGGQAAGQGHGAGAFALYRTAYTLALRNGWLELAAGAAAAVAGLARAGGGHRSERRWRRRAAVLARRAARG